MEEATARDLDGARVASGLRDAAPFALTVACIAAFSFLSGGYLPARSTPIALAFLLLTAVFVGLLRRRSRPSRLFLAALLAYACFVAWAGLSLLWSFGPDLTWVAFNLAAFYLAVAAVLGLTPVRALQLRIAGFGFLAVAVAVGVYAFLGKVVPDVVTHAQTYARLDSPVGYWNVLALMMVMGLLVALALAGDGHARPVWRVLAAAGAVPLCFTFFFCLSRGGWLVLVLGLLLYFGFSTTRLASAFSLAAVATPVAAVIWHLRRLETLFTATTDGRLRTLEGHSLLRWSLLALALTVLAQTAVVLAQRLVPWPRAVRVAAGAAIIVLLAALVVGGSWRFLEPRGGLGWVRERVSVLLRDSDQASTANGAGRLLSLNTGRPPLWREALDQSRHDRLRGTGAGTFPFTHYRYRTAGGVVKHAHSQWFNVLSELGVIGLVLFVAAVVLFVAAAVRNPFAGCRDPLRPLVVALQAGVVIFVVHLSWDWDWDMAAIGTVAFLFIAACSGYLATRAADERRAVAGADARTAAPSGPAATAGWPLRAAACLALLVLALSWLPPYLSTRAERAAIALAGDGKAAQAASDARRAARLDPLAADPLITEALVLQQLGRNREALSRLDSAARLQPDNYEIYYQRGLLLLRAFGRKREAVASFERALALNPLDQLSRYELELALGA
jgi:O-Antigen ligase